ncbi:TVP38/TMEM64 family protein [Floccifex sp.]|uniref:TVP38/TMEM64 family protein n=1 Tax=Floccifex sp. TaxID=2815810 RepID=UPI003EFE515A
MIIIISIIVGIVLKGWIDGKFSTIQTLKTYILEYGMFGPIVLTILQMMQVILPVLPGFFGCIVGASIYGATNGFWINYIGISLGSIFAFLLARKYGVALVKKMISIEKYERFVQWIQSKKSYTWVLFLSILLPLAPDDFLCYFSGLCSMSFKKFTWIIVLAKPWCILFYCLFFAYFI